MSTLLALEFSSEQRSVAVWHEHRVVAEIVQSMGKSTRVFSLITGALKEAGILPAAVDTLAVGVGPGSYTGVRLAISVAQGWSLARPAIQVRSINSLDVLAAAISGRAWLVSDAQRSEWAVAPVEGGRLLQSARLFPSAEVVSLARSARVIGPEVVRILGVGETAFPSARVMAQCVAERGVDILPEALQPVYLRTAAFVKAPAPRQIPGISDLP